MVAAKGRGRMSKPPRKAMLRPAGSIQRERVEWLWPNRIPLGAVSLTVGDPGLGKSMLTCWLAARLSREGKNSILATAEDSLAAVVRPRLEAAGADLDRVTFVHMLDEGGEDGLCLPDDIDELEKAVAEEAAVFVSIDPLTAHLPAEVNSWRDQSIRLALAPLHRMAERQRCAVNVIVHLNKSVSTEPLRRVGGSIGIPAAARSALLLARDPDDPDGEEGTTRVLAQVKTNYGVEAPSLRFGIESVLLPASDTSPDVETARLVELGECEHRGETLLASRGDPDQQSAAADAEEFLLAELDPDDRPAKEMKRAARDAGIHERTLERAKAKLKVKSYRKGGIGAEGVWYWHLPKSAKRKADLEVGGVGGLSANPHEVSDNEQTPPLSPPSKRDDALSDEIPAGELQPGWLSKSLEQDENGRPKLNAQEKAVLRDRVARERVRRQDEEREAADAQLDLATASLDELREHFK
jgi:hypothetical protein